MGLCLVLEHESVRIVVFQAEDGIRDYKVTGVQTCALPILVRSGEIVADRKLAGLLKCEPGKHWFLIEAVRRADAFAAPLGWTEIYVLRKFSAVVEDRKSTRLNSSHLVISYAVFCLKKKIQT